MLLVKNRKHFLREVITLKLLRIIQVKLLVFSW